MLITADSCLKYIAANIPDTDSRPIYSDNSEKKPLTIERIKIPGCFDLMEAYNQDHGAKRVNKMRSSSFRGTTEDLLYRWDL